MQTNFLLNISIIAFSLVSCANELSSNCEKGEWAKTVFSLEEQNVYKESDPLTLDWNLYDISSFTICKDEVISLDNPVKELKGYHVTHLMRGKDGIRSKSPLRKLPMKHLVFPEKSFEATTEFFQGNWVNAKSDIGLTFHYEIREGKLYSYINSSCQLKDDGLACNGELNKGTTLISDLTFSENQYKGNFHTMKTKRGVYRLPLHFVNRDIILFRCGIHYLCSNYGVVFRKI